MLSRQQRSNTQLSICWVASDAASVRRWQTGKLCKSSVSLCQVGPSYLEYTGTVDSRASFLAWFDLAVARMGVAYTNRCCVKILLLQHLDAKWTTEYLLGRYDAASVRRWQTGKLCKSSVSLCQVGPSYLEYTGTVDSRASYLAWFDLAVAGMGVAYTNRCCVKILLLQHLDAKWTTEYLLGCYDAASVRRWQTGKLCKSSVSLCQVGPSYLEYTGTVDSRASYLAWFDLAVAGMGVAYTNRCCVKILLLQHLDAKWTTEYLLGCYDAASVRRWQTGKLCKSSVSLCQVGPSYLEYTGTVDSRASYLAWFDLAVAGMGVAYTNRCCVKILLLQHVGPSYLEYTGTVDSRASYLAWFDLAVAGIGVAYTNRCCVKILLLQHLDAKWTTEYLLGCYDAASVRRWQTGKLCKSSVSLCQVGPSYLEYTGTVDSRASYLAWFDLAVAGIYCVAYTNRCCVKILLLQHVDAKWTTEYLLGRYDAASVRRWQTGKLCKSSVSLCQVGPSYLEYTGTVDSRASYLAWFDLAVAGICVAYTNRCCVKILLLQHVDAKWTTEYLLGR
ncbi:hypothetical protein J6590_045275 [Homalodisca vitripennis]|nr:hypothetical protein J6590_045275 [Homalodisca vitripennis]